MLISPTKKASLGAPQSVDNRPPILWFSNNSNSMNIVDVYCLILLYQCRWQVTDCPWTSYHIIYIFFCQYAFLHIQLSLPMSNCLIIPFLCKLRLYINGKRVVLIIVLDFLELLLHITIIRYARFYKIEYSISVSARTSKLSKLATFLSLFLYQIYNCSKYLLCDVL